MSTIKPIDVALVEETARKVKLLVTAEDHHLRRTRRGGCGSFIPNLPKNIHRIGMHDAFGESGKSADLYKNIVLTQTGVWNRLKIGLL